VVPRWASHGGGGELQSELGYFGLADWLPRLGYGELRAKARHRPRSVSVMSASFNVAPLVGGIVEELLHLPRHVEPQTLRLKT
jgi:hypothetical protein